MTTIDGSPAFDFPDRDLREETLNSVTHAIGLMLSVVAAGVVVRSMSGLARVTAWICGWYVLLLMLVFAVSALSHAVQTPRLKNRLRAWDQGLIYLFIAATYTPLVWFYVPGGGRIFWLLGIWIAALGGVTSKVIWQHRVNASATWGYLLLGWGPALGLIQYVAPGCSLCLVLGGLCYTVGVIFLKADQKCRYFHALWHVLVILGSSFHYAAILNYVVLAPAS